MKIAFNRKLSIIIPKFLKRLLLIIPLCFALGCTHTREITKGNQAEYFQEINNYDGGRTMTVNLTDNTEFNTNFLTVAGDSTFFMYGKTNNIKAVKTSEIREISQNYTGNGFLEGLACGALGGFTFGFFIGLASGDDTKGFISFSAETKAFISGIGLGLLSGTVGSVIGLTAGSNYKYMFRDNIDLYQSRLLKPE